GRDTERMRPDIENLMRQGLVAMKAIPHEEMGSRKLLTLTKNGHRFLTETQSAGKGQVLYSGFTKAHKPRRRSLPALPKGCREDRGARRQKSPGSSRLRDEEATLPRSREARSWQGFFRAKTSRC